MILMNGLELRKKKLQELKEKLTKLETKPGLAVIQVTKDEASIIYTKNKEKLAKSLGYNFKHIILPMNINENDLINQINLLNNDNNIDGIIIDMPLPKYIDKNKVINSIDPKKDIDGVTYENIGRIIHKNYNLIPSTPKAIKDLLDYYKIPLKGENVVVIGRSLIVGKPIANILTNEDATVTLCHSKTKNIEYYTKNADIIIVAVGKKHFLTKEMVSYGSVVIDVGINSENNKIYGDVDFEPVSLIASYITPGWYRTTNSVWINGKHIQCAYFKKK